MAAPTPLEGITLIDCAKANAKQGLEESAAQCGYGEDLNTFKQKLIQACQDIGVDIEQLSDLITTPQLVKEPGVEIAPDTPSEL